MFGASKTSTIQRVILKSLKHGLQLHEGRSCVPEMKQFLLAQAEVLCKL